MNTQPIDINVHRFGDHVAFSVPGTGTIYLSPKDAREFAGVLADCAANVESCKFTSSAFGTKNMAFIGKM